MLKVSLLTFLHRLRLFVLLLNARNKGAGSELEISSRSPRRESNSGSKTPAKQAPVVTRDCIEWDSNPQLSVTPQRSEDLCHPTCYHPCSSPFFPEPVMVWSLDARSRTRQLSSRLRRVLFVMFSSYCVIEEALDALVNSFVTALSCSALNSSSL